MNSRGFTLIELTVAVLISAIAGALALTIFVQANRQMMNLRKAAITSYDAPLIHTRMKMILRNNELSCIQVQDSIIKVFPERSTLQVDCNETSFGRKVIWSHIDAETKSKHVTRGVVFGWETN